MTTRNKERPKKSDAKTRVVLLALRKTLFYAILDNFILLQFLALLFVLAAVYWSAAIGETFPAILAGFMLAIITVMNVNMAAPMKINGEKDTFVPTSEFVEYIIFRK